MRSVAIALFALLGFAVPAVAEFPGVNGRIAYDRFANRNEIWLMNQDGSEQHKIAAGRQPAWSPDGTHIAYVSGFGTTSDTGELAVMNADGSGQHVVDTDLGPTVSRPSWSPDGKQLLLSAFGDVYLVSLAGGRSRLLVRDGGYPAWSPDGSLIAFVRGYATIMLVKPDGSDLHQLVPAGLGNTSNPRFSWSPDGKRIAFTTVDYTGIDAIDVDGTNLTKLVPAGEFGPSVPAWSPDGKRIAFFENADLCTAAADGSGGQIARLTYTPNNEEPPSNPAWQPLPPGSQSAGVPGGSAGPAPDYPRGKPWFPSCDRPEDELRISSAGPSATRVGSWVTYTLSVKNEGASPIGPVLVSDVLSRKVPARRPSASQGHCASFTRSELSGHPQAAQCELGGLLPGDVVKIRLRLRLTVPGSFTNTGIETAATGAPQKFRSARTKTRVVSGP